MILEKNIELKQALVTAVVPASKHIVSDETLSYDKLVIGMGSKPNKFGCRTRFTRSNGFV
jgi:NADH dehydrogenase FAD-containing subunit